MAYSASQTAAWQRDIAIADGLISNSQELGNTNASVARQESIAAWTIDPTAQARYAMLTAAANPQITTIQDSTDITRRIVAVRQPAPRQTQLRKRPRGDAPGRPGASPWERTGRLLYGGRSGQELGHIGALRHYRRQYFRDQDTGHHGHGRPGQRGVPSLIW